MSDYLDARYRDRRWVRKAAVLVVVLLGLALVAVGGSLLAAESATPAPQRPPVVGRTSVVCTVPTPADPSASPEPSPSSPDEQPSSPEEEPAAPVDTSVSAVTVRQDGAAGGRLVGAPLAGGSAQLDLTEPGTGAQLASAGGPVVLAAEGAMATSLGGTVFSSTDAGEATGLMAAPCLAPGTEQWFTGLGSTDADRTELILSNPDEGQAEVDLRFYGPGGRVVVPGSPGVVVGGGETRTVSVPSLVDSPGPVAVAVRASEGRVSVAARRLRTAELQPAGADWQVPSAGPATTVAIPGIPGGAGRRVLEVVNPGPERVTVRVEVLGLGGVFAPAGADTVEVGPESTASVDLTAGLVAEASGIRLSSDRPVTGSVVSSSQRSDAIPDLAVQAAQPGLVRQGLSAVATTATSTSSELVLSNSGEADAAVSFEVVSYAGVSLRRDDIVLGAGSSATRRLTSPGPSYVVVSVPDGSTVVGSVTLSQPEGDVAGLATVALVSPDVASRAPQLQQDPAVGR